MLSLYYVTATFLQSWRIKKACTKIAEKFSEKSSVVFYVLPKEGYEENMVTSELCTNRSEARVSDLLWLFADQRGCCLMPSQSVHIGPWVTFPESPTLIPFESIAHEEELILDRNKIVHLLLETDILPSSVESSTDNVMIEKYGKPIAWKVDSHFAVLLETDIDNFTSLLIATFLQNNLYINDWLPLIRIESVSYEGQPQPFEMMKKHLRKQLTSRSETQLSEDNWKKHLDGLRSLSVLANQATEFEYNKNRTEGKTGIVKPDLIPSGKIPSDLPSQSIDDAIESVKSSPVKISGEKQKIEAKVSPMKRVPEEPVIKKAPSPMKSPAKSPAKYLVESRKEEIKSKPTEVPVESKSSPSVESVLVTAKIEPIPRSIPEPTNVSKEAKKEERKADPLPKKVTEPISAVKNNTKRPSLRRSKDSVKECKPPNVLVYSDVATSRDSVVATLKNLLERDMYTVYPLTSQQVQEKSWIDNTSLLVICGSVPSNLGEILVDYFLCGGKLLSLCSDVLHIVLPTYRTAEVREHELVQFSYDKWQKVKMMHYIFCYHPSPVKKNFSTDSEESGSTLSKKPALVCPRSIELKDLQGDMHNLDVKVLGNEETWNTPSLLLANNVKSGGRAVFSQVHLETDPSEYESDDTKYKILKENERNRLEIFADLLVKHLGLTIKKQPVLQDHPKITYQNAYFLGRYELKFEALQKLERLYDAEKMIKTSKLSMKFCGKNETLPSANTNLLPILLHSCPEDFSTVDYFDNLVTSDIGRLVIYAPIISSSMHVISDLELVHGLAVLPKQQTDGVGRSSNQWLSPLGCAMFSLQLHIPLDSELGSRLPLIQHIIGLSVVSAIKQQDKYQFLDLGVKWPNDIYVNGLTKIGGLVVTSKCIGKNVIINVGLGFNLDNKTPTICLNDLIEEYNRNTHQAIAKLNYELWMALVFNEIERLTNMVQSGHMDQVYELYYKYWLHDQQEVDIQDKNGRKDHATIIGIDDYGFLKIKTRNGKIESVQPDGNSFDMLKGLILPKFN